MNINKQVWWLLLICNGITAQNEIPIGSWRTHFSYRDAHSLAISEFGVYCGGANTLFFLDFQDQNLERIGKLDGLSEGGFSTIAFHSDRKVLVIAYTNGNIDLLSNNLVTNIDAFFEDQSTGSKKINHISFDGDLAYLATDVGVVVIDLVKAEVMEAYKNLGENGEIISINHGAIFNDTIFLATQVGILAGSLDASVNLQDFRNWKRFDRSDGMPPVAISTVAANERQLFATIDYDGIYKYHQANWQKLYSENIKRFISASSGTPILITDQRKILSIDTNDQVEEIDHSSFLKPKAASYLDGNLWIADSVNGMVTDTFGEFISLYPNGPFSDSIASAHFQGDKVIALPAGFDKLRNPLRTTLGFYLFDQNDWNNYNASNEIGTQPFPAVKDLVDISFNPLNNKFYMASFGEGMVEWEPDAETRILDETSPGSTLENIMPGGRNVWVNSVKVDQQGMVWVLNYGNARPIHRYHPESENWTAFESDFQAGKYPLDLQIAQNDDMWLPLDPAQGGGIWVFNPGSSLQRHLTNTVDEGGLPGRTVRDLQIDHSGQVWLATEEGVFHYPFPFDILDSTPVNASAVLIEGRPLLADEPVTCISVDGGNRKWIGTNNGVWLVSEQGDEVIQNFNVENSPLPSNKILDVTINQNNGEVFIVTDLGMVSYRGTATNGGSTQEAKVKIFPNPVNREYQGLVGISGVVSNATVKIADLTGKLVNEVRASGSTAVWNINDFQGRRVSSGVYLIFSSSPDGEETFIGKIAVIN